MVEPEEPIPASALDGIDVARIPIYCANLAASKDRRARMERRFAKLGLLDRVHFVPAVGRSSRLVDQHQERVGAQDATDHRRAEVGCLLSHVRTMRTFLRDTPASVGAAIVFEDDVMLHRDWERRLERVLGNLPADAPVCALGHLTFGWVDSGWAGMNPTQRNLVRMLPGVMWGSHAYWVTRDHARAALRRFEDEPGDDTLVSEALVWQPDGFAARPPLVITDWSSSNIASDDSESGVHRRSLYAAWGIENYLTLEEDGHAFGLEINREPQTICLCMIVRDESKVIDRLADSVRDLIDTWVICDTGSTDGTPERVLEAFKNIPGELFHDEWQDYGTNRTLMLERARGRADYLLILDADHTLRVEGLLPHLDTESYSLLVDEKLAHWVPRLVRGDLPWRYVGAAHEYITSDEPHRMDLLPLLVVEHHADGGNRSDKLQRERELLEKDLAQDPDNARTVFYLAQTYREMGEDELAIQFYAHRLRLGGWPEEMFYAMYRHAELVSRTDWDLGVSLLLETWEYRPTRAEPLFSLTQGFRLRNQFRLGALFGAKGKEIAFPNDFLFVHREHYEWAIEYEWSICAFNIEDFEGALGACEHLLTLPTLPAEVRDYVAGARRRCLAGLGRLESDEDLDAVVLIRSGTPTLGNLIPGAQIGEVRLSVDPPWPQFNPTIAADGDGFKMLVRTANYILSKDTYRTFDDDPIYRSIHYEVDMGPDLSPVDVRPILDTVSPSDPVDGRSLDSIEDCRLVQVGSRWFALGFSRRFNDAYRCQVVLIRVVDGRFDDLKLLEGPDPAREEKNWMPFVVGGELFILYSCSPTVVLRCDVDSGKLTEVSRVEASHVIGVERGGSQGVDVGDGTLFVTHSVALPDGRRVYEHRFLLMDPEAMKFVAASRRFRFLDARVEFCGGMAIAGQDLVLSFGVGDANAYLARVPYEGVRASLWPL